MRKSWKEIVYDAHDAYEDLVNKSDNDIVKVVVLLAEAIIAADEEIDTLKGRIHALEDK